MLKSSTVFMFAIAVSISAPSAFAAEDMPKVPAVPKVKTYKAPEVKSYDKALSAAQKSRNANLIERASDPLPQTPEVKTVTPKALTTREVTELQKKSEQAKQKMESQAATAKTQAPKPQAAAPAMTPAKNTPAAPAPAEQPKKKKSFFGF